MEANRSWMVMAMLERRTGGARRVRVAQRWLHLASAVALLAYVYLTPDEDSFVVDAVRWIGFPFLAASGVAMWQWPRIRRLRRRRIAI